MFHLYIRISITLSLIMTGFTICLLLFPAFFPFLGLVLSMNAAYALILSLLGLCLSVLCDESFGLNYYDISTSQATLFQVLFVLFFVLTCYISWCAFSNQGRLAFEVNTLALLTAQMTATLAAVICLATMFMRFVPWYLDKPAQRKPTRR